MKKRKILNKLKDYTYFLWLIFLILLTIFVTYFYDLNKKNQISYLNKSLSNIYLKNSIKKISSNLKPRYISLSYRVNEGDTYEKIINSFNLPEVEKRLFLKSVVKNKNIKILKLNQNIYLKIDKKDNPKIPVSEAISK